MSIDPVLIFRDFGVEADSQTRRALDVAGHRAFRSIDEEYLKLIGQGETPSTMAEALNVTQQAVSRNVHHLVRNGYLRQRNDRTDRRRQLLTVTDKGRAALAVCSQVRADVWATVNVQNALDEMVEHVGAWLAAREPEAAR